MDYLGCLVANHFNDAGMGMTQSVDTQPRQEVEVAAALNIVKVHPLAASNGQRVASVSVQQVFLFQGNNFFIRQHDDDLAKFSL